MGGRFHVVWGSMRRQKIKKIKNKTECGPAVTCGGTGAKTTMMEAVMEVMAIAGGADNGATTTATVATMVTVMTMTRLNICDASTEEKERPSNPSRMHASIK